MTDRPLPLIVESLLFAAEKAVSLKELSNWIPGASEAEIAEAIAELKAYYDSAGRSFCLREAAGGFQFCTEPAYAPFILRMMRAAPARLSRAAMETLAIIAYKQPILRQEIERLRGVDAGGVIKLLMEKDLVRIVGRKNLPGRPLLYGTTRRFLEVFDLKDLDSLPKLKEIKELDEGK
jgi:segregation and condensation protein B